MHFFKNNKVIKIIWDWGKALLIALVIIWIVKNLGFDIYGIENTSMRNTLLEGDAIIVSKWNYGLRLPITIFALPFTHLKNPLFPNYAPYIKALSLPYSRIFKIKNISRNDVIVFNYPAYSYAPVDKKPVLIKRCVGLPGDTLFIRAGMVYINHCKEIPTQKACFTYCIKFAKNSNWMHVLNEANVDEYHSLPESAQVIAIADSNQLTKIKSFGTVRDISIFEPQKEDLELMIFPANKAGEWNLNNYGPIIVPHKGATLSLDTQNLLMYEKIIRDYENNDIQIKNDSIFINNKFTIQYSFKLDYYFVLGDNRHNSADSRYWGFVPENHIIGKASRILFSVNHKKNNFFKKIRWKRCFKKIK